MDSRYLHRIGCEGLFGVVDAMRILFLLRLQLMPEFVDSCLNPFERYWPPLSHLVGIARRRGCALFCPLFVAVPQLYENIG